MAILINEIMLWGMNGLTLTSSEIIALKQAHRACKNKHAADRIKAVYSLGVVFSVEEIDEILMLDKNSMGLFALVLT